MKKDNFLDISTYEAQLFCSIYDTGNTTETAKALRTKTANVSVTLKRLEQKITKEPLFVRNRRLGRYVPTNIAERIEPHMRCIVQFAHEIMKSESQDENSVMITTTHSLLEYFLGPYVAEFMKENPEINLSFKQDDDLKSEQASLNEVFLTTILKDESLYAYFPLHNFKQKLWASPKYIDEHGNPSSLEELKKHRLLVRRIIQQDSRMAFGSSIAKVQLSEIMSRCDVYSARFIDYLCQAGCGIMPASEELIKSSGLNLEEAYPGFKGDEITVYVSVRKESLKKEAQKKVINWIFRCRNIALRKINITPDFSFTPLDFDVEK
ncbi:MAG: LysR family transcriptional regulator [Alphaproteobacteria bacterium]|jgi:DNA-binding transcriptional LysR family regulator|nr:LysR family transcriptional regulator [Alphaproteobacteria bacterium]